MKRISQYNFYLLAICFFMGSMVGTSQTQNMDWLAESLVIMANDTEVELVSNLTKQGTSFTWEQVGDSTSDTSIFTITAVSGNWNIADNTGELTYDLTSEESSGSLTLDGNADGVIVILSINGTNGATNDSYTFYIETLSNL